MKLLAIDRDLEHYLRVIAPGVFVFPEDKTADMWLDKLMDRYNLSGHDVDLDAQLEAILQAQMKADVIYKND